MNNNFLGINFGFKENKFFVEYRSCSREPMNLRLEFDQRARDLYYYNKKLMLGISSGLDSQTVMHSFCSQGIDIEYAFLYMPGYNDYEFGNLKKLSKKYSVKPIIIDIDPELIKEEILSEYNKTKIPPSHIMQAIFLEKLPTDYDFIQGIHGPDILFFKNQWFLLESANSIEVARLRSLLKVKRTGQIIGWERTPEITASLLTDEIIQSFKFSYNYMSSNNLAYKDGSEIPIIDYWDLYIKPFIYGKYWKDELEYFPKMTGLEKINWIQNGPKHDYRKNLIKMPYDVLVDHLTSYSGKILKVYED